MCRDQHQHFYFCWDDNWIHGEKYHPWPSMIWVIIDNSLIFFPTHVWSRLGYTLDSLLFLQLFFEYFLWSSTPTPTCNTVLMLPRSMTEVFRVSTRTLEEHCRMFLDLLSKHHCMGNIMIVPSPLYLNAFELTAISCISWSASCGKDILLILVCKHIFLSIGLINPIISFSFPLVCLTFLWSIWYKQK